MKLILLSGGAGNRLWPLSNDFRPKQFLKLLKNKNNQFESMVKRVWSQLELLNVTNQCYFITSESQVEIIKSQLGNDVPLILEPEQRDTFPAIALVASYLYSVEQIDLDEVICILPVDHDVEDHFYQVIWGMEKVVEETSADISLIGVRPMKPSEKYGYIVPGQKEDAVYGNEYFPVARFIEKPSMEEAIELIKEEALWNCGVFSFTLKYMISLLTKKGLPTNYHELIKIYSQLPKISFDYEVLEKAKEVVVVPYNGYWEDLGTWDSLTKVLDHCLIGKGFISEDSKNTHLINELTTPINILGISDAVIVASYDGILVTDKKSSIHVKDLLRDLDQKSYEDQNGFSCRVLDYCRDSMGNEMITRKLKIIKGKKMGNNFSTNQDQTWTIISGEAEIIINGITYHVKQGDILKGSVQSGYEICALTNLEMIEVQFRKE